MLHRRFPLSTLLCLTACSSGGLAPARAPELPPEQSVSSPDATALEVQRESTVDVESTAGSSDADSAHAPSVEAPFKADEPQLAVHADRLDWKPCPPGLPPTCRMAILEGDPNRNQLFTLRLRTGEAMELPPHRHPRHERMTVLAGTIYVGFGETLDKSKRKAFNAGDYYVNRAGVAHYIWSDGPVTAQITGIGPWRVEPVSAPE